MSRDHKYRAWDTSNRVMVYSGDRWRPPHESYPNLKKQTVTVCNDRIIYPYSPPDGSYVRVVGDDGRGSDYYKYWDYDKYFSEGLIFLQYIGKKARHGKEICQGDICRNGDYEPDAHAYNYRIEEIMWDDCNAAWSGWNPNDDGMCCEIIGNVHEHPERLEGKQ